MPPILLAGDIDHTFLTNNNQRIYEAAKGMRVSSHDRKEGAVPFEMILPFLTTVVVFLCLVPFPAAGRALQLHERDSTDCGHNDSCCTDYNDTPNWFWDWLLLTGVVDGLSKQFDLLYSQLATIDGKVTK